MNKKKLSTIQKRQNLNKVYRLGESGPGGAYHHYTVAIGEDYGEVELTFQKGPRHVAESQHSLTDQDLLEIVRDRLTCFSQGDMPTPETVKALEHLELALMYLNKRVEDRIERAVLGTYEE